jgi:hypothetical protein
LIPGRGTPIHMDVTIGQMRAADIPPGGLSRASTDPITNWATSFDLANHPRIVEFIRTNPGVRPPTELLSEIILQSSSGRYMESVMTQTGHRIESASVQNVRWVPLDRPLPKSSRSPEYESLKEQYINTICGGVPQDCYVPREFIISFELAPL